MRRDKYFWPDPADHYRVARRAWNAGDVTRWVRSGDDLDTLCDQAYDHPCHSLLVARDGTGRKRSHDPLLRVTSVLASAIRESAARGSPWLPVHCAKTLSGGR